MACIHYIGKAENTSCTCRHPSQDGEHLVLKCPNTATRRDSLLPFGTASWESRDNLNCVVTQPAGGEGSEQDKVEGIEACFQDLYWKLKNGYEDRGE